MLFTYSIITGVDNHWWKMAQVFKDAAEQGDLVEGGRHFALWSPHFGLAMNDLVLMLVWPDSAASDPTGIVDTSLSRLKTVSTVNTRAFEPTIRPTGDAPLVKKGLYIHRWMEMKTENFEEAIALSGEAWVSFEKQFDTRPMGLFREKEETDGMRYLLLVTWYRDFAAWETSRNMKKTPEALKRFIRRHEMTRKNFAYAMNLMWRLN
jgi:hypothetical protein